jgi:Tfp pilus assembly protein PilF
MIDPRRRIGTLALALCLLAGCGAALHRAPAPSPAARSSGVAQAGAFAARGLTLLEQGDHVRAEQYLMLALRAGYDEHALIDPLLTSCIASNRLRAALSHADRYLARNATSPRVLYVKEALERALGPSEAAP